MTEPRGIAARFRPDPRAWIEGAVGRIVEKTHPKKVILFGSHAYGNPGPDSDVDLFVVLDSPMDKTQRYHLVSSAIGTHEWPLDLLVRSSRELEERLRIGDYFFKEVLAHGKVLYES